NFPVHWERPAHTRQFWTLDRQHFGRPLPPMAADVWRHQACSGINRAFERYQLPIRLEICAINGYLYNCHQPVAMPPEPVLKGLNALERFAPRLFRAVRRAVAARMAAAYLPKIAPVIGELQTLWEHNWLPEIREHLAFWHAFDLPNAPEAELAAHLAESLRRIERLWDLHFEIMAPAFIALNQFQELHRQHFGANTSGDPFAPHQLLHAESNSFLQADRALWLLSRKARTLPSVRAALERLPADEIVPALERCTEGQIFLAELRAWLNRYGMCGQGSDGLSDSSWLEEPLPVFRHLQSILRDPENDLEAELRIQAAERNAAVEQAHQRLLTQPAQVRERYMNALRAAQTASFLSMEHHFWIDQQAMFCLRRVFLEIGRRGVAMGAFDRHDDVLYLTNDEVRSIVRRAQSPELRTHIAERKTDLARARTLTPPSYLGTRPLMPPPPEDPFVRAMTQVLGAEALGLAERKGRPTPREFVGQAASPGVARGPVRILRELNDSARLRRGDILVAEATLPVWTPLFTIAAGVVTDVGGTLSHAAITAREYGIPAVVGARDASTVLRDDQLVELDGSTGVVRLIE
ncbi:MAG TPA: PEP-utilizing enzyme, partial [Roseiflexaceae bacterium]|nr:PEP-utilizing enzyme [Roseiflexaceae bacterium]